MSVRQERASANTRAQMLLSDIYFDGLSGVVVDKARGLEWLRKAMEHGDITARRGILTAQVERCVTREISS